MTLTLRIELLSDATFGRGDGVAGVVDQEIDHDESGFPFIGGKALKGLLAEESRNLVRLLSSSGNEHRSLFGHAGAGTTTQALHSQSCMHVDNAVVPEWLRAAVTSGDPSPTEVLEAMTYIRRLTSVDQQTGAPRAETLRSQRVVLRTLVFHSVLRFRRDPEPREQAWLAGCALAVRRGGARRNRGRGRLAISLWDQGSDVTEDLFHKFKDWVNGQDPAAASPAS